ncbi:MAG TPA: UDP-N-acetylmuramoyl-L-alanyl-D-glutamate--2,6-diaminopimelate ligase [Mizugakiibacter sp.]|nr:UDP-N-acetylmuramoyl-L-alanyl-D-glutamate--2,6-diaminopimelate ligase [Mizugakiibacter sp.]
MSRWMHLDTLLTGIVDSGRCIDLKIAGLSLDSRQVVPGAAFLALQGLREHGITHAAGAVEAGAKVVLAESPAPAGSFEVAVPVLWIRDLQSYVGILAARWYGRPSRDLVVIGVTGTNGKTSVVQLLAQALQWLGHRSASIGTLGAGRVGDLHAAERTTPDAIAVQALLARFREQGVSHVAMEVSSHGLEQGRVNAVDFEMAVLTNLSRDHLDYHSSMESYGAAKMRLFQWPGLGTAILNLDDPLGVKLQPELAAGVRCLGYSLQRNDVAIYASDIGTDSTGIHFRLHTPWGSRDIHSPLLGRFNVANLLAVVACLGALNHGIDEIARLLPLLQPVRGRMNRVGGGAQPLVVIDYAHTPDALQQALLALRRHCVGHLYCVFGCGGERDVGKRPQMGAIAARLADRVLLTDDNPRGEDGAAILEQIRDGMPADLDVSIVRKRDQAIFQAVLQAKSGDVVLIAGKGHESYQEVNGRRRLFDDMAEACRALESASC